MAASRYEVKVGGRCLSVCGTEDDKEALDRFRDLRADLRQRAAYEVTNADVLEILLDCYWVHRENEPVPFERLHRSGGGR